MNNASRLRSSAPVVSTLLATAVALLGLTVILGWFWHKLPLIQIHPSFPPMQFNSALSFMLCGTALIASQYHWPRLASVLAAPVALIGSLTLVEYLAEPSLGIDELFIQHYVTVQTSHPGRMAPNGALSFLLSGTMLLIGNSFPRYSVVTRLAALVSGLGFLGLYGYIIDVEPAYGWGQLTRMALHSSVGFILLGLALALWGNGLQQTSDGRPASQGYWNMFTVHISVALLVVVLALWQTMSTLEDKSVRQSIGYQLARLQGAFVQEVTSQLQAQGRMANRWQARLDKMPQQEWEADARYYVEHSDYVQAVAWVDETLTLRWRVPRKSTVKDDTVKFSQEALGTSFIENARRRAGPTLSDVIPLTDDRFGFILSQPVLSERMSDGFILAMLSVDELMSLLIQDSYLDKHGLIQLFSGEQQIWSISGSAELVPRFRAETPLVLNGVSWRAVFTPTADFVEAQRSLLPDVLLFGGLLMIVLLQYFYLLHRRDRIKTQLLEAEIVKRQQNEEIIKKYTQELERSNAELNDFAYVTSHDLKAPLRGIMQLTNWIEEDIGGVLEEQTQAYFDLLKNRVARLEKLLDDLLAYSRVGRKHGDIRQVDVQALVQEIFVLLNPRPGISLQCQPDLPVFNTLAVPLEQVLRNLIDNAIKHHDKPLGVIKIFAKEHAKYFEFTVADDGPGIPPQHQERVFALFQTLKPRDVVEGSGMGLAIVKKLVENYQGKIRLESDGILGTSIHFSWPKEHRIRKIIDD